MVKSELQSPKNRPRQGRPGDQTPWTGSTTLTTRSASLNAAASSSRHHRAGQFLLRLLALPRTQPHGGRDHGARSARSSRSAGDGHHPDQRPGPFHHRRASRTYEEDTADAERAPASNSNPGESRPAARAVRSRRPAASTPPTPSSSNSTSRHREPSAQSRERPHAVGLRLRHPQRHGAEPAARFAQDSDLDHMAGVTDSGGSTSLDQFLARRGGSGPADHRPQYLFGDETLHVRMRHRPDRLARHRQAGARRRAPTRGGGIGRGGPAVTAPPPATIRTGTATDEKRVRAHRPHRLPWRCSPSSRPGWPIPFPSIEDLTGDHQPRAQRPSVPQTMKEDESGQPTGAAGPPALRVERRLRQSSRLFKSDGYLFYASLYPTGNYIQKDDGTATTPGGVLISWYQKYNLDITDPNIDREDPDKDGFSNKIEFFNELPLGTTKADGSKSTSPLDARRTTRPISPGCGCKSSTSGPSTSSSSAWSNLGGQNLFQIALTDVAPNGPAPAEEDRRRPRLRRLGQVGVYTPNAWSRKHGCRHQLTMCRSRTIVHARARQADIGRKVVLPAATRSSMPPTRPPISSCSCPARLAKSIKVATGQDLHPCRWPAPPIYLVLERQRFRSGHSRHEDQSRTSTCPSSIPMNGTTFPCRPARTG